MAHDTTVIERVDGCCGELVLQARDGHYEIVANGVFLMDTRDGRSERLHVKAAADRMPAPGRMLIGGLGADTLRGGGGDDILIGGRTSYDANQTALLAVMKEWGRTDADYSTRVKHLNGTLSGGLNGSYFLKTTTVREDNAIDSLYGEAGLDWFFARKSGKIKDKINDPSTGEVVTAIS